MFLPRRWVESAAIRSCFVVPIESAGTGAAYLNLRDTRAAWNPERFYGRGSVCGEEYDL